MSHKFRAKKWLKNRQRVAFAASFVFVGIGLLVVTRAATNVADIEAETSAGSLAAADSSASGGKYLQFKGAASTPPVDGSCPKPAGQSWAPLCPGTAWHWQLQGTVNENVLDHVPAGRPKMMDIDMWNATSALIGRLKNKGIYVVCYVESGDWLNSRPDAGDYPPAILGKAIGGFPNEKYINVAQLDGPAGPTGKTLRQIMQNRLNTAKNKGCQGIEPDLDDLHTYGSGTLGFSISKQQMVDYNKVIIDMGHALGMSVGLKNGASSSTGTSSFESLMLKAGADWALNEECNQFSECAGYTLFEADNRAVFQVEFLDNQRVKYDVSGGTCDKNNTANFDGLVRDSSSGLGANSFRYACRNRIDSNDHGW